MITDVVDTSKAAAVENCIKERWDSPHRKKLFWSVTDIREKNAAFSISIILSCWEMPLSWTKQFISTEEPEMNAVAELTKNSVRRCWELVLKKEAVRDDEVTS